MAFSDADILESFAESASLSSFSLLAHFPKDRAHVFNPEQELQGNREYRLRNADRIRAQKAMYRAENRDLINRSARFRYSPPGPKRQSQLREANKRWRARHPERVEEYRKRWLESNKDWKANYMARYAKANHEKRMEQQRTRRAAKKQAEQR